MAMDLAMDMQERADIIQNPTKARNSDENDKKIRLK